MHMNNWPRYCQFCGSVLSNHTENHFYRGKCTHCGEYTFLQHKVGIAAVIFKDKKLLLLKRAQEPWKGYWNFPAGFLEYEESILDGVKREVFEEVGFRVNVTGLHYAAKYCDDPRGNGIVMFYDCEFVEGEYVPNDEVEEFGFFSASEIPDRIASSSHQEMLAVLKKEGQLL